MSRKNTNNIINRFQKNKSDYKSEVQNNRHKSIDYSKSPYAESYNYAYHISDPKRSKSYYKNIDNQPSIMYFIKNFYPQLDYTITNNVIEANNKLKILLKDGGCTDDYIIQFALDHKNLEDFTQMFCRSVAEEEKFEVLKFTNILLKARNNDFPWNDYLYKIAIENNNFIFFKWLHENKCPWNCPVIKIIDTAAKFMDSKFLRYMHENNCLFYNTVCASAAVSGNFECLEYGYINREDFVDNDGKKTTMFINAYTYRQTAAKGYLDCLRFIHEHSPTKICRWDLNTVLHSALNAKYDCLRYAIDNGCKFKAPEVTHAAPLTANAFIFDYEQQGIMHSHLREISELRMTEQERINAAANDVLFQNERIRCATYLLEQFPDGNDFVLPIPPPVILPPIVVNQDGGFNKKQNTSNISTILLGAVILFSTFMQSI